MLIGVQLQGAFTKSVAERTHCSEPGVMSLSHISYAVSTPLWMCLRESRGKWHHFAVARCTWVFFVAFSVLPTLVLPTNVLEVFSSPLAVTFSFSGEEIYTHKSFPSGSELLITLSIFFLYEILLSDYFGLIWIFLFILIFFSFL